MKTLPRPAQLALQVLLLVTAGVFLGLHFTHLRADFPNASPWMDWSKYTDEGWYGDAAIRHFQLGHWYVPGDFNPAAALPVLPFFEGLVFRFTGVSLIAARVLTVTVFAGILLSSWLLLARRNLSTSSSRLSAATTSATSASVALFLLAVSPFCFVFTRMAIIEPLLVLLTLLALLAASRIRVPHGLPAPAPLADDGIARQGMLRQAILQARPNLPTLLALGLLLPLMVLTKTTALFLMPAVFFMLFARASYRIPAFLRMAVPVSALALLLWGVYFFAIVRPHFLLDFRYLFSANAYTAMTRENWIAVVSGTLKDGRWIGHVTYPVACLAVLTALVRWRALAAYPLIPTLLLWSAGYMAFLAYHNNLQPRYYLVVAIPLTLLIPVVFDDLILPLLDRIRALALILALAVVAAIAIPDARQTLAFVRHPQYTLVTAAQGVAAYIADDRRTDPAHNPLILSISGSDISLMTGVPSICDDFGTLELVDRIRRYQPGWYVAWNQVEDDKLDSMSPQYQLERVAAFPAMDDPDRNLLVLYKMYPADSAPRHTHPRTVIPRRLRSRVGQQPSANQLVH